MTTVKVGFVNLKAKMSGAATQTDFVKMLDHGLDVLALAEIGGTSRAAILDGAAKPRGLVMVRPKNTPVPIFYRAARFELVDAFQWHLSDATRVGPEGAGPPVLRAKEATVIVVRDLVTGGLAAYAVAHLAPSLRFLIRSRLHRKQVAGLAALVDHIRATHGADVDVTELGDFNCDVQPRLQPLLDAGLDQGGTKAVTHPPKARIDHILSTAPMVGQDVVRGLHTDHNGVVQEHDVTEEAPVTRKPDYPKADAEVQWFGGVFGGSTIDPNVVVLHTTETTDWPGYNNAGTPGDSAPHYTAKPDLKACATGWRQHFSETISARALRNEAGGVETNTLNCVQVELIGTCDSAKAKTWKVGGVTLRAGVDYIYWPDAPAWALKDLAAFLTSIHKRRGVRLEAPKLWLPYPASYGQTAARMTGAEWEAFYGVCGHQHVPENSHGDPGDIDITTLLTLAGAAPAPDPRVSRIRARIKRLRARLNHILGR